MQEYTKRHSRKASYEVLQGNAEEEIGHYLNDSKADLLVVLGAYQRNLVSRWFRRSMADVLMKKSSSFSKPSR